MFDRSLVGLPREPGTGIQIVLCAGEPIDSALRRLKKLCEKANVIKDYRRHEHFISRSERRRWSQQMESRKRSRRRRAQLN